MTAILYFANFFWPGIVAGVVLIAPMIGMAFLTHRQGKKQ